MLSIKKEIEYKSNLHVEENSELSIKDECDLKRDMLVANEMSSEQGSLKENTAKEKNHIRQLAFKAREKMPKDYKSFCLVAEHLFRNVHRYKKEKTICEDSSEITKKEMMKKED